jgi:hypothetical protein
MVKNAKEGSNKDLQNRTNYLSNTRRRAPSFRNINISESDDRVLSLNIAKDAFLKAPSTTKHAKGNRSAYKDHFNSITYSSKFNDQKSVQFQPDVRKTI